MPIEFDDSVVFKGKDYLLVPVSISRDFVQWHLVSSEVENNELSRSLWDIYPQAREPIVSLDYLHLSKKRHILGYCPAARTIFGTLDASLGYVLRSNATPEKSTIRLQGFEAALGSEGLSIFVSSR